MSPKEAAKFYREMARRGILLFEENEKWVLQKVPTPIDNTVFEERTFSIEDDAIDLVMDYINWSWVDEEDKIEQPIQVFSFGTWLMVNFGFGPQMVELESLRSTCDNENWHKDLQRQAEEKAVNYIKANHPDFKLNDIKYQVQVKPIF